MRDRRDFYSDTCEKQRKIAFSDSIVPPQLVGDSSLIFDRSRVSCNVRPPVTALGLAGRLPASFRADLGMSP
jgi:hypothetical protein